MSTIRRPVGPRSPRVYWRRRIVVLAVLLAVIGIVVFAVSRAGAGSAPEPPADDATSESASPAPSPTEELVAGAECLPRNLRVDALTDKVSYAAGELPQLSFTITNTAGVACTYNLGSTQQTFIVTSGEEQYWSSRDCLVDPIDAAITLEPNLPQTSQPIAWDRTRSSPTTCETERPAVPAGGATFALGVTLGAVESEAPKTFLLF